MTLQHPEYTQLIATHERLKQQYLYWTGKPDSPVKIELCELLHDTMEFIEKHMAKIRNIESPKEYH